MIDKLCTRKYETAGALGLNFFTGNTFGATNTVKEAFLSPAAPLGAWVGVRYSRGTREA